jgi:hypothetical protein
MAIALRSRAGGGGAGTRVATRDEEVDRMRATAIAGLVAVGMPQLGDLLTFIRMVAHVGIVSEANPLVAQAHMHLGLPALLAVKVALVVFVVATVIIVARRHPAIALAVLTLGMVAGIVGTGSNVLATIS